MHESYVNIHPLKVEVRLNTLPHLSFNFSESSAVGGQAEAAAGRRGHLGVGCFCLGTQSRAYFSLGPKIQHFDLKSQR